jgi:hypothetical protein
MKKKLTKADLKKTLAQLGFKEGDEIIIPSEKSISNESTTEEGEGDEEEGDGNGGNHPPKKGGN